MKTIEEFYKDFSNPEKLRNELKDASDKQRAAFLKKNGCNATVEDFGVHVAVQNEGAIAEDDLETVTGGGPISHGRRLTDNSGTYY